jgi:hypothetical protein
MASGPPAYQFFFLFGTGARGDALLNDRAFLVETFQRGAWLLFRTKSPGWRPIFSSRKMAMQRRGTVLPLLSSCANSFDIREHETEG